MRKLYETKLRDRLSAWFNMEKKELNKDEYGQISMGKEAKVHICKLKQGPILGEDDESDEKEEILDECLME